MKTTTKVAGIIGGVAAAALGAYFYAKTPKGKKQVAKIKTKATLWANSAKRDILKHVKDLKEVNQKNYSAVVDAVMKKYKELKKLAPKEVAMVATELKKHWNNAKKKLPKKSQSTSKTTSWGKVDEWYDDYVEDPESYHQKVVEPNLIRILGDVSGKHILDLGCGQGYFCRLFAHKGAIVSGVDVSPELIEKATDRSKDLKIRYVVSPAEDLFSFANQSQDIVVSVLATQNMRELDRVIAEVKRILKPDGRLILILNHPAFRVPQDSDWYYNPENKKQGRVVTRYMSEATVKIDMHPGSNQKTFTYSFHRPLQVFVKWLAKNNLAITRLEEWISHKESATGPRKDAEDRARKETPLFMCIEARLLVQ